MGAPVDLTVACVLRSGGQYHAGHVRGLMAQVEHWLPGARFVCLSDLPVPCERIPLARGWPGWWSKLELFEQLQGRTLYLDLDSVIVADPAPLVTGEFLMIQNWIYQHLFASGVMSWEGDHSHIARAFAPVAEQVMREYVTRDQWGDQAFIAEQARDVKAFPWGAIGSYRYQRMRGKPMPGNRIVAFNGDTPPWRGPQWARRWWPDEVLAA